MTLTTFDRKPPWIRSKIPGGTAYAEVRRQVDGRGLHTVCQSASCPNLGECWSRGTATFMILGNTCSRGCRFCDVPKGKSAEYDADEPRRLAESVRAMGLRYAVITSVNRDDLSDQGAALWAQSISEVREMNPDCYVEVLIPDMRGRLDLLDVILDAGPDILNHNLETVERLQAPVRGRANFKDSSSILRHAKSRGFITKTSLMLGLGEEPPEIESAIFHCADLQVDILTLGQYLRPNRGSMSVARFAPPEEFAHYKNVAEKAGIPRCESGPMVRSSYRAEKSVDLIERR